MDPVLKRVAAAEGPLLDTIFAHCVSFTFVSQEGIASKLEPRLKLPKFHLQNYEFERMWVRRREGFTRPSGLVTKPSWVAKSVGPTDLWDPRLRISFGPSRPTHHVKDGNATHVCSGGGGGEDCNRRWGFCADRKDHTRVDVDTGGNASPKILKSHTRMDTDTAGSANCAIRKTHWTTRRPLGAAMRLAPPQKNVFKSFKITL